MSTYTVKYNRSTNHIDGIAAKCTSTGEERGGVVASYAQNACGVLTRGRLATGKSYRTIQEAYDAASKHTRRICKTRSEEHTSELQSLMRTSYAVFCLQKKHNTATNNHDTTK